MKLYGGIYLDAHGMSDSARNMHLQSELMGVSADNIAGFDKPGYQRNGAVVSKFSEEIGVHALAHVTDESLGRLIDTSNPLDFAMGKKGYFQYQTPNGVTLSRDGRFKLDKEGSLLTLEGYNVLGDNGMPIKFTKLPSKVDDIKVSKEGKISFYDKDTNSMLESGNLSVVLSDGSIAEDIDVRQGFTESSNVSLQQEFFDLVPIRRNFQANRQLFIIQNDKLSRVIQELGRSS